MKDIDVYALIHPPYTGYGGVSNQGVRLNECIVLCTYIHAITHPTLYCLLSLSSPKVLDRCIKRLNIQIECVDLFRILDVGNDNVIASSAVSILGRVMRGTPPTSLESRREGLNVGLGQGGGGGGGAHDKRANVRINLPQFIEYSLAAMDASDCEGTSHHRHIIDTGRM